MEETSLNLKIETISKSWRDFRLTDINLEIGSGDYFVILGPTGSGKTLLIETLMGFHSLEKGRIWLDGKDISSMPPEKRCFGYVPQNCMLFPHMSVQHNIEFGLKMRGLGDTNRKERVRQMLDLFDLEPLANRLPMTLSGGEKQKVALARALVIMPKLVLLDEPLSFLDAETKRGLREYLRKINRDYRMTVIHVTHDQVEALSLANKIAVMKNGRIEQVGNAREVFSSPRSAFVAKFLGYENIFKARLLGSEKGFSLVEIMITKRSFLELDVNREKIRIYFKDTSVKVFDDQMV
jgi:molybdate/tungstate transport system ATP-binding protein